MFNNNINKPAITVFLPLTSAKTSFCRQKLVPVFTGHWQKLANPDCTVYPARSASVVMLQQCLPPAQHLLVFRVHWMQVEIPPCQECSVLLPSTVSAYL